MKKILLLSTFLFLIGLNLKAQEFNRSRLKINEQITSR